MLEAEPEIVCANRMGMSGSAPIELCGRPLETLRRGGEIAQDAPANRQAPAKADGACGGTIAAPLVISDCGTEVDGRKESDGILCHAGDCEFTVWTAIFCRKRQISKGACNIALVISSCGS
jgi:hypothetical protein